MSTERKQMFARLMGRGVKHGNYDIADDLVANDFINYEAPDSSGPEGFKATARWLRPVFPDYRAELHETVSDGDLIVARLMVSGTHRVDFVGVGILQLRGELLLSVLIVN